MQDSKQTELYSPCCYVGWDGEKKELAQCSSPGRLFLSGQGHRFEIVNVNEANAAMKRGSPYHIVRARKVYLCEKHAPIVSKVECSIEEDRAINEKLLVI